MSATGGRDLAPGDNSRDNEEATLDPGTLGDVSVPMELLALAGAMALLAFQVIIGSVSEEDGGQQVAEPLVEEDLNIQPVEEEEEKKEGDEEDSLECAGASGVSGPEGRALNTEAECKMGYYFEETSTVRSLSFLAKKAMLRHYLRLIGDYHEPEGEEQEEEEEEDKHGKPEEGPKK